MNTVFLDQKYIRLISSRFEYFKEIKQGTFRCRCPICNDSQKKKTKARFYLIRKPDNYLAYCQNCQYSKPFWIFLKNLDKDLYREYQMDSFQNQKEIEPEVKKEEVYKVPPVLKNLKKISSLSSDHPAKKYVVNRLIPSETHYKLYYTPHFSKWINSIIPDKLYDKQKIDPRLVLPLFDRNGVLFGVSARDLRNKSELRYITIRFDEDHDKIFNLDNIDPNYTIYVVEGAIDAFFVPNCIATLQGDLSRSNSLFPNSKIVYIPDRDIRNIEIMKNIEKLVKLNCNVCLLPKNFPGKDINEAVCNGLTKEEILKIIKDNTFTGLELELKLATWRKC